MANRAVSNDTIFDRALVASELVYGTYGLGYGDVPPRAPSSNDLPGFVLVEVYHQLGAGGSLDDSPAAPRRWTCCNHGV